MPGLAEPPPFDWESLESPEQDRATAPREFVCEDFDDIEGRDLDWLVKDLWPRIGLCYLVGPSMAGKSFLAMALMSSVAKGAFVLGRRSARSAVLFVVAEGANGARLRIEALRSHVGAWQGHMHFIGDAPNLTDATDLKSLWRALVAKKEKLAARGIRLGAVVIDTLSASIPGADENSAKDMSPVLAALQKFSTDLEVCILVVAHLGKDAERGIRGWSGQFANADAVVLVGAADTDGVRLVTIAKVKDGEAGAKFAFALKPVHLRNDADGDPVTTCIVDWRDVPEPRGNSKAIRPMKPRMRAILTALAILEDGGATQSVSLPGIDPGARVVTAKELQDAVFANTFGGVEPDDARERRLWRNNRSKNFANNLEYLIRDGFVGDRGGFLWRLTADDGEPT